MRTHTLSCGAHADTDIRAKTSFPECWPVTIVLNDANGQGSVTVLVYEFFFSLIGCAYNEPRKKLDGRNKK